MEMNEPEKFDPRKDTDVKIELMSFPTAATAFDQFPDGRIIVGGYDGKILFYKLTVASNTANRRRAAELQDQAKRVMNYILNREGLLKVGEPTPVLGMKTLSALVNYKLWGRYTNNLPQNRVKPVMQTQIRPAGNTAIPTMEIVLGELISFTTYRYAPDGRMIDPNTISGTMEWKFDGVNMETVHFGIQARELQRWNYLPASFSLEPAEVVDDARHGKTWDNNLRKGMREDMMVELVYKALYQSFPFLRGANLIGKITIT
jgi:hypothetical protein